MRSRYAIAALFFLFGVWIYLFGYPYLFQFAVEYKLDAKRNAFMHTRSPTPSTPYTPNPDLIYSIAFYDLSSGDMQLTGQIPMDLDYFSIAFYQSNTSHYAIVKKDSFKDSTFKIVLTQNKSIQEEKETVRVVSPTKSGTIIIRYYYKSDRQAMAIAQIQKNTRLFVKKQ